MLNRELRQGVFLRSRDEIEPVQGKHRHPGQQRQGADDRHCELGGDRQIAGDPDGREHNIRPGHWHLLRNDIVAVPGKP